MNAPVVIDASAMVELLIGGPRYGKVAGRVRSCELHAPAHLDAEVLSALGRLHRGGVLGDDDVTDALDALRSAPIERHHAMPTLARAWQWRHRLRLTDALYAELAEQMGYVLVTCDRGLASAASHAELISS